jgi:hypothetical protein
LIVQEGAYFDGNSKMATPGSAPAPSSSNNTAAGANARGSSAEAASARS